MTRIVATTAVNYEWMWTFSSVQNANFTMGTGFTFDQDAWSATTTLGNYFAYRMFSYCSGDNFTMGDSFNLPQTITTVGIYFAVYMFYGCKGASFTMNSIFTLPQRITTMGYAFCANMFHECNGASFTMGDNFNLPQNITIAGDYFAGYMFQSCKGDAFTMNSVFNVPQGIKTQNGNFLLALFTGCSGANFTMNSIFNLPQGITGTVGGNFASNLFAGCFGVKFTMNSVFNMPQNITAVGNYFGGRMFYSCYGAAFQVNSVFKLTHLNDTELTRPNVYSRTFFLSDGTTTATTHQARSAVSILNGNAIDDDSGIQSGGKQTFFPYTDDTVWDGLCSIQKYFGGFGVNACFMLHYDRNGGTGGTNLPTQVCMVDEACNLAARQAWAKDGYFMDLANWNSLSTGGGTDYAYGLDVKNVSALNTPGGVATLYAKWTELTLTLTITGTGDIGSLTPGGAGSFNFAKTIATVTTNNPKGWSLSFTTDSPNMKCTTEGSDATIPSTETETVLAPNSWGYGVFQNDPNSSTAFNPVAASPASNFINSDTTSTGSSGVPSNLYFAANAGMDTVACTYNNTITITAVAPL
jgi:hypothetical protein